MILGAIADDFTGGGDLASILADGGMRVALLTHAEDRPPDDTQAAVIALKTRSIPARDAVRQSLAALDRLRALGCDQIYFKYCSTFDSTPDGNIGPVAEALAKALDARGVVVCPAFPANGRTVYQGNLFVGDVPLAESGMRTHPLTPMTDSDIRRWLARQSEGAVGHVPLTVVREGSRAVSAELATAAGLVVVDAVDEDDLRSIGKAAAEAPLVTGGSALALGLVANYAAAGLLIGEREPLRIATGPALLLSGSCSPMTNRQVARYRAEGPSIRIDAGRVGRDAGLLDEIDAFLAEHAAAAPLAYSTDAGETAGQHGAQVATDIEGMMAELARRAAGRGVRRFIVAGGETSGAIVEALRPGSLKVGPAVAPGVPTLAAEQLSFVLKSGNFATETFFADALAALAPTNA